SPFFVDGNPGDCAWGPTTARTSAVRTRQADLDMTASSEWPGLYGWRGPIVALNSSVDGRRRAGNVGRTGNPPRCGPPAWRTSHRRPWYSQPAAARPSP